ncbi:MAG TPA: RNA 2'-phosphotransferase [Planctomycetota bacterium]|nr:RNA 2'-phosphotransferase [Planctomycetota bacterium]
MVDLVGLSKLMSLILRHEPEKFGVVLDAEGYTPLQELLEAIRKERPAATEADLRAVVETVEPQKQRYSIVEADIRANYGHSIDGKIRHAPAVPPALLFHGTAEKAVAAILTSGLRPMARQYVHLTEDRSLALKVGGRHGKPRLIRIDAMRAHREEIVFYKANRSFWLADVVPAEFLLKP